MLAHAYLSVPAPTTYIVPVEIQKVNNGPFGFRTEAKIPRIAGGAGIPLEGSLTIGKKWTFKGERLSYVNASCPSGKLQAKVEVEFTDATKLSGLILKQLQGDGLRRRGRDGRRRAGRGASSSRSSAPRRRSRSPPRSAT